MNLNEFVATSLTQIVDGIADAQKVVKEKGARINPTESVVMDKGALRLGTTSESSVVQMIEFDMAVTTDETDKTKGGIAVFSGLIGMGTQGERQAQNSSISRIKFSVPLVLPKQD